MVSEGGAGFAIGSELVLATCPGSMPAADKEYQATDRQTKASLSGCPGAWEPQMKGTISNLVLQTTGVPPDPSRRGQRRRRKTERSAAVEVAAAAVASAGPEHGQAMKVSKQPGD